MTLKKSEGERGREGEGERGRLFIMDDLPDIISLGEWTRSVWGLIRISLTVRYAAKAGYLLVHTNASPSIG
ncbi:MAG TPA: hypothetical protein DCY91_18785 [Cyanobacteria bacterium UBA11370]|nr:hypothetical protein [Cyanobacteria bacterium UBA11370]